MEKLQQKSENVKSKSWLQKYGKNDKNREKNLQFYGVNESKIQWTVLKIKFIKGKNFSKKSAKHKIKKLALKIWKE